MAPDFALAVFKGLSYVAPHAHILHLKNEDFSRDPKVVETMNDDPLIAHQTQPTQTLAEMVRAHERLKEEFPLITLPVLILHGTLDNTEKQRNGDAQRKPHSFSVMSPLICFSVFAVSSVHSVFVFER